MDDKFFPVCLNRYRPWCKCYRVGKGYNPKIRLYIGFKTDKLRIYQRLWVKDKICNFNICQDNFPHG